MGLGPPIFLMLVWQYDEGGKAGWRQSPLAFVFPFLAGVGFGLASNKVFNPTYAETGVPPLPPLGSGGYKDLLGVNVYGQLACIGFCALGFAIDQWVVPNLIPALARPRRRRSRTSRTRRPAPASPASSAAAPRRSCRPVSNARRRRVDLHHVFRAASLMPPFYCSTARARPGE